MADAQRLERLRSLRPGVGARQAAVLILIGETDQGPDLLFVERAATMRSHPGQIAFPGGGADQADVDLAATAVREAVEETGVEPSGIEVFGSLPTAHVAVSGYDVTPVTAWWRQPSPVAAADPREVASVHRVGVHELSDPASRVQVRHPSGYTGPAFEVHDLFIWGLTAHFVDGLLDLAGWQTAWDKTRMASIPERYLTDSRSRRGNDAY
nr:CoA pyrophosphatase [Microlunatus panaciterrae]